MKNLTALWRLQGIADLTVCLLAFLLVDNRGVAVPPAFDLIRNVADFEDMRRGFEIRHKCTAARNAIDVTLVGQFP